MTNKDTLIRNDRKPRLRLLDLTFEKGGQKNDYNSYGSRPHGGLKGSKKHPLSPYSYNKPPEYHKQITDDLSKLFHEEFIDGKKSPSWALGVSKEVTHSGESPFFIHGLLGPSRSESEVPTPVQTQRRSTTPLSTSRQSPKHTEVSYYRPVTPHSYLKSPDPQSLSQNDIKYGRPTRTTLLRARSRCASAPVNKYEIRREMIRTSSVDMTPTTKTVKEIDNPPSVHSSKEAMAVSSSGESSHAFLTGARYNRAHFLDAKSLSVYGVYMPRTNPQGLFMTGHAVNRSKDRGQTIPSAPPDSPRSDVDESSKPVKRPFTAPGKRLLSSSMHGRPRTAWGESTSTTCHVMHGDNEKTQVLVTFKSNKQLKPNTDSILPSVTGRTAPTMYYRRPREAIDDLSSVNQPPPTPSGVFSARDGSVATEGQHNHLDHSTNYISDNKSHDNKMCDGSGQKKEPENGQNDVAENKTKDLQADSENPAMNQDIIVVDVSGPSAAEEKTEHDKMESVQDDNNRKMEKETDVVQTENETDNVEQSVTQQEVDNNTGESKTSKTDFFITKDKENENEEAHNTSGIEDKHEQEENPTSIHVTITEKSVEKSS